MANNWYFVQGWFQECLSRQLCMCLWIIFQFIAHTNHLLEYVCGSWKKASPLFISLFSLCLPCKATNQCGPSMYIWCISTSKCQDIAFVIPSDDKGSIADNKLMASGRESCSMCVQRAGIPKRNSQTIWAISLQVLTYSRWYLSSYVYKYKNEKLRKIY